MANQSLAEAMANINFEFNSANVDKVKAEGLTQREYFSEINDGIRPTLEVLYEMFYLLNETDDLLSHTGTDRKQLYDQAVQSFKAVLNNWDNINQIFGLYNKLKRDNLHVVE